MTARYYPLCALVAASGLSEAALARSIGLSGTTLKNARVNGLREDAADRYACRAGLVPWLVWPDWLDDAEVECAERGCPRRFVPVRRTHRYCSERCRRRETQRAWQTARYQSDPEFAQRERERSAAYYAECREYVRARQQRTRGTSVEHPDRLISPGQSNVSEGLAGVGATDGTVAA